MFDLDGGLHRKNPLAAVEASGAPPSGRTASLLLKVGHAERHAEDSPASRRV